MSQQMAIVRVTAPATLEEARKLYNSARKELEVYHKIAERVRLSPETAPVTQFLKDLKTSREIWWPRLEAVYASNFGHQLFKVNN